MRIFMYVLKHDSGFAPNPFDGWCTLACCKPAIRRRAQPGDWVVGITPRSLGNDLAYAMQVEETFSFEEYWQDRRFRNKRPRRGKDRLLRQGDNCYQPLGDGKFRQLWCAHWDHDNDREGVREKAKDLRGKRVLVGRRFSYFGANPEPLPARLSLRLPQRFNRVNFTATEKAALLEFLGKLQQGIRARPRHWPEEDRSWRPSSRCG